MVLAVTAALVGTARAQATGDDPLYQLVDAATQRLLTADAVAASKWITGGPITDPGRVQQVLAAVVADAESSGVPSDYVTRIFNDQINATEAIQYSRFSWWKLDPTAAPSTAPDLSASRSQIDALNHRMVSEIGAELGNLRSADCAVELDGAKSRVAAERELDPLYRQALDAATRSYCR